MLNGRDYDSLVRLVTEFGQLAAKRAFTGYEPDDKAFADVYASQIVELLDGAGPELPDAKWHYHFSPMVGVRREDEAGEIYLMESSLPRVLGSIERVTIGKDVYTKGDGDGE